MTMKMSGFPRRLAKMRKEHGYTQKALAEIAGIHWHTIRNWEEGLTTPRQGDGLIKTATALGVSVKQLLTGRK
jgi:DNA-binding XRE family transcriptional regulator